MNFDEDDLYDEEDINNDNLYLTFSFDNEEYAIGVENVKEIVKLQKIIPVPDVANFISGVINLRGKVIPVMDICKRFNLPPINHSERTIIIVLEFERLLTGVIVEKVNDVIEILPQDIDLPSQYSQEEAAVKGVGKKDDKALIILDISILLNNKSISKIQNN